MQIPFLNGSTGKHVAIADIGGGGSAIGLVTIAHGKPSTITHLARGHLHLHERQSAHSLTQLTQLLREAGEELSTLISQKPGSTPSELFAVVHAPWVTTRTIVSQQNFKENTRITDAMISDLAKKALADSGPSSTDLFEASVSHVELNGYRVHEPSKHSATQVEVVVLVSEMKREYRDLIEGALSSRFPGLPVKWRSYARAMATLIHESSESRNAVIIDMGDDATSISVMRKQILDAFETIPLGLHSLIAKIAPESSYEETLALLTMLESDTCSGPECDKIRSQLSASEGEIVKLIGGRLGELAAQRKLPDDLFVLAHPDIAPWLARFLSRIDFAQFTTTGNEFATHALSSGDLARLVALSEGVRPDASFAVAAALVHTEAQSA